MRTTKIITIALLITAQAAVWAMPGNPHAPKPGPSGTVVASEDAGRYTYVQIDIEGEKVWYAVPASAFTTGEKVIIPAGGLPMKDFYSKVLDRTFDIVYFVGAITPVNAPKEEALPPGHPPIDSPEAPKLDISDFSNIERPEGGKTVEEIFQQQDALAEKSVLVRGKAVKVSNGILGRNWVHLRDGSGEAGSNDLTITTDATVQVGDTITVRGILGQNQDFGAGYKYDVLLEGAEVQAE